MRKYKPFLIVLAVTTLLWLLLSMSDTKEFPATYHVHYVGYDTNRFALLTATDSIQLSVASTGFQTLKRNRYMRHRTLTISLEGLVATRDTSERQHLALPLARQSDELRRQLGLAQENKLTFFTDGLNVSLALRRGKPFVPHLRNVGFEFAEGYCLGGEPRMLPDTVWLYGSQESLDRIGELATCPATIACTDTSIRYSLWLDSAWRRYSDLRISTPQVQVFVPVEAATERTLTLPLRFRCDDTSVHARLYPEQVEVSFWVPTKDYSEVEASQFEASVTYNDTTNAPELRVAMDRFPAHVQIRKVEPSSVKYVVIK